jgi:F420-0:gamma-glutamyl ligase
VSGYSVFPVMGIPELHEGDDLATLILERAELEDNDIVVVAQKAISKTEGRTIRLDDIEPSDQARPERSSCCRSIPTPLLLLSATRSRSEAAARWAWS